MKKIFTVVLCLILAFSMLAGCGKTAAPAPEAPAPAPEAPAAPVAPPVDEMVPVEDEEEIDPAFGLPAEGEEGPITIEGPTGGETPENVEIPTPAPTATPSIPAEPETVVPGGMNLQVFFDSFYDKYEMAMTGAVEGEMLDAMYPGLSDLNLLQCVVQMPMISAVVSEYVFVQCANADDVKTVQAILQARIDEQANGGAWYPESMENWAKAKIVTKGNYVALIAAGDDSAAIAADFEKLF